MLELKVSGFQLEYWLNLKSHLTIITGDSGIGKTQFFTCVTNALDGLVGFDIVCNPSLSIQVLNLSDIITIQLADYQEFDILLIDDLEQSIDNKERRHIRNRILNELMSSTIPYLTSSKKSPASKPPRRKRWVGTSLFQWEYRLPLKSCDSSYEVMSK